MMVSALGVFTSPSSIEEPAGNHRPSATYFFNFAKSAGIVFLHEAVTVRSAEIENIMRILFEEGEIILHGLANVFVDDLGILPSPFGIEVGVTDHIERGLL